MCVFKFILSTEKVDSSDRKRMGESTGEFNELLKDEKLKSVPIIVLANKQDLSSSMKSSEVAELIGLVKLKDRDWQIQACSALEGTGLQEAMDWICKCVKK
jgi:ADP-ribosylation factor-like protein 3